MLRPYVVTMKDGSSWQLMAANRTAAMVTAMELANTKEPPVSATQVADW